MQHHFLRGLLKKFADGWCCSPATVIICRRQKSFVKVTCACLGCTVIKLITKGVDMIPKQVSGIAVKAAAVAVVVAGVATAGFDIKETKATLAAPTGKCGFSLALNASGLNERYNGSSSAKTVASIGVIDFDAGTSNFVDTKVSNWGAATATPTSVAGQNTFTVTQGSVAGQYVVNINNGYGTQFVFISTNTANTYLMQELASTSHNGAKMSGICQAL